MAKILEFQAEGYRDAMGRYARRSEETRRAMRDAGRSVNRALTLNLKHYAPEKSGKFKVGIRSRTWWTGDVLKGAVYATGEHAFLLDFLTGGTRPHQIPTGGRAAQMAKGYPLRWTSKSGEVVYAWEVNHPGTFPDPFVALAIEATEPTMDIELARAARRIAFLSG